MVATVIINEHNGPGATPTNKTKGVSNVQFANADTASPGVSDRVLIPNSGTVLSFQKYLRMEITVAPDNQIDNILAYFDGANGMGTGVAVYGKVVAPGSYATPVQPPDLTGYVDVFANWTSGSPQDMDAGDAGPHTTTGAAGDYAVLVMQVSSTASPGNTGVEDITFQYDEQ